MSVPLKTLLRDLEVLATTGDMQVDVTGITNDSRKIEKGYVFLACEGARTDGHRFIPEAIRAGAAAVVHSVSSLSASNRPCHIRVADVRRCIAPMSAAFFGHPSREMLLVGVTGTNGKSTTAYFLCQLLEAIGKRTGLISTTFLKVTDKMEKNPMRTSTPEANDLQALLREMADAGNEYAVVEATSHGLSAKNNRLGSTEFNAAVFTNLTHEHLEFHGSMEAYRNDKANLFRFLDRYGQDPAFGIVNLDSPAAPYFMDATNKPVLTYSVCSEATLAAELIQTNIDESVFIAHSAGESFRACLPVPGSFNVENALAAMLTASKISGVPVGTLIPYLEKLRPVPGRQNRISAGQPFRIVIDFAHSPDAFERILPLYRRSTPGRLIVVFGSAGERDVEKRAQQGAIADRLADMIVLTDEDPRGESSISIIEDIAAGCANHSVGDTVLLIPERRDAIRCAVRMAKEGDTVLLLGKGHESSIEYADGPRAWDEEETARSLLAEMGYLSNIHDGR